MYMKKNEILKIQDGDHWWRHYIAVVAMETN